MYCVKPREVTRQSALVTSEDQALDDLLFDWFCWEAQYSGEKWYSNRDATCGGSASSRQWMSTDDIHEASVDAWQMKQVAAAMDAISGDHALAIRVECRNRRGPGVWRNPRAGLRQPQAYAAAKVAIRPWIVKFGVEY
jgi:hypothetical protein